MSLRGMVVVCLVACGGGGGGGDDAPVIDAPIDAPVGRSMIGPAGGAVMSMDGVATLTIPAGALTADVEITIDALPQAMWPADIVGAEPIGAVYSIGPGGTTFTVPATLEWRFATAPASARDNGSPRMLFGFSRSASGTIEPHESTDSEPSSMGSLTVVSSLTHLSDHLLTTNLHATAWGSPLGTVSVDVRPGRHGLHAPWSAAQLQLAPSSLEQAVYMSAGLAVVAPVQDVSPAPWVGSAFGEMVSLQPGTPWAPSSLPRFECTGTGTTTVKVRVSAVVPLISEGVDTIYSTGRVLTTHDVECYEREQKPEYTVEAGFLGQTRIAPLAVPATTTVDLALHQGAYGHQVCVLPGQTIRVCVGASMPTAVNYFPQYPPGFTFVDGPAGSGCVSITNLDPNDSNCVLVKSEGGGSPNNVTVTTTTP